MSGARQPVYSPFGGSVAARVRQLINAQAPQWPTLEEIASQLAISRRTLARRLCAENLGFQSRAGFEPEQDFEVRPDHRDEIRIRSLELAQELGPHAVKIHALVRAVPGS